MQAVSAAFIAHIGHRGEVGLPGAWSCDQRFQREPRCLLPGRSAHAYCPALTGLWFLHPRAKLFVICSSKTFQAMSSVSSPPHVIVCR